MSTATKMKVLIGCERSGRVRDAMRACGICAISCDLVESAACRPHIVGDILSVLESDRWDAVIAFPPCTYLSNAGIHRERRDPSRIKLRDEAIRFSRAIWAYPCEYMAVENPVGKMREALGSYSQIVHPYYFGDNWLKRTCLWLRGFPPLRRTHHGPPPQPLVSANGVSRHRTEMLSGGSFARSLISQEIADAMANQWAPVLRGEAAPGDLFTRPRHTHP